MAKKAQPLTAEQILAMDLPISFTNFSEVFPWPTRDALRQMYQNREANGLKNAFRAYGTRKNLVFPKRLFKAIDAMQEVPTFSREEQEVIKTKGAKKAKSKTVGDMLQAGGI